MQEKPDPNVYVLCDYGATGEGRTVMTMVTRASPRGDDYVTPGYIDENGHWQFDRTTKNTPEERALKEFKEHFGDYYAMGAEVLDRVDFFGRVGRFVPEALYKLTDPEGDDNPPGFHWTGSFHYNYS
jgi:hypothetical protein